MNIEHIKLKNHKAIREIRLNNLGQLNIICGKNNSGKSSVLESIVGEGTLSLGVELKESHLPWWRSRFENQAKMFTTPDPKSMTEWFNSFIEQKKGTIFYGDEMELRRQEFLDSRTDYLKEFSSETFEFEELINEFLIDAVPAFKPILIPPKRILETAVSVGSGLPISPNGTGVLKRLFFLGTQDLHSSEHGTYERICNAFTEVTDGYFFSIRMETEDGIRISFSIDQSNWIPADACGLGLQDILVMLYFVMDPENNFIMIEEPESHIHPYMQRRLLRFMKARDDKQFFFSTHSNIFLDTAYADKIVYSEMEDEVKLYDETSKADILRNLGYSIVDNIVSDLVILTEGPYDVPVIEEICKKLGFWHKHDIKCWPLGGDTMLHVDLSVFKEKNKVIAVIDSDPGSESVRREFQKHCKEHKILCRRLKRYSTENYFSVNALRKVFGKQMRKEIKELKPNVKVEEQIGFSPKASGRKIIENMDIKELEGTDLLEFCKNVERYASE